MSEGVIRLRDGRALSYAEYGDPRGWPLVFFHGTPGSRLFARMLDGPAKENGVRIVAPERPGYGRSDPKPRRRIPDWPDDVTEFADSLGLARFAVAGASGGGPYSAVCAHRLGERLISAGILSGIGPSELPGATRGMLPPTRVALWLGRRAAPLARVYMRALTALMQRGRERSIERMARALPASDQAILADPEVRATMMADLREALVRGTIGVRSDFELFAHPWGFRLEDIRARVFLWHGELDRNCPVAMGHAMAKAIPGCQASIVPGEGHLFTLRRIDEVFRALR